MSTEGPLSPGTMADDSSAGSIVWNTVDNAKVDDANYATVTFNADRQGSHYLKATNFGFAIPTDATIAGIKVEVEDKASIGSACKDVVVELVVGGSVVGSNLGNNTTISTTEGYVTYGGETILWGIIPTPAQINGSDFGAVFQTNKTGTSTDTVSVNHIRITVYYSVSIVGTTVWGHDTGVTETNVRDYASNWTGTGAISGSGDAEVIQLNAGEYMESETVQTGSVTVQLLINAYASADTVTIQYRTGATQAACEAASYSAYSAPFASDGFVGMKLVSTL